MGDPRALVASKVFRLRKKECGVDPSLTSLRATLIVSCGSGSEIWGWVNVLPTFFFYFFFLFVSFCFCLCGLCFLGLVWFCFLLFCLRLFLCVTTLAALELFL